jgi:large subunit ribosomal protein L10
VDKEQKTKEMTGLKERLEKAKAMIFTEYRGLKVSELNELRSKLRKEGAKLKVVKNRLMKRVLKEHNLEAMSSHFVGPTAITSSDKDPVAPVKILVSFAKDHAMLVLKGGLVEGAVFNTKDFEKLATLPSREELLAKALSSMNAPATNLACVLSAVTRKLLYALNAIKETKQA